MAAERVDIRPPSMGAHSASPLIGAPATPSSSPSSRPASRVAVALHEGFYGASSGTGFSNRALLEVLARTLPPGRLLVLPTHVPHENSGYDQRWTLSTQRLLDSVGAEVAPVPCPHLYDASVHDSETLCEIVGDMACEHLAGAAQSHVIGLDIPFLSLAPYLAGSGSGLLLIPRSTSLLADPANHRRIRWERSGLITAVTRGARVAAISKHMRTHLKHQYGVPAGALVDLPNGLLLHASSTEPPPAPLPPRARAGFLLAMGRAVESKGFEDLIEAVAQLRDEGVRLPHLVLAATGPSRYPTPYQRRLHEQARDHGLDVTFPARFSPVYRTWLRSPALRAVVVPSRAEPFGRIPLEAFAEGAGPVVATRVGGLIETVLDGETGFLAEPDNLRSLAQAIQRALLITAREREHLRRRGQALLTARHDYGATIRSYVRDHIPWALEPVSAERRLP
ncbi:glycosyltransferase family 4 protein [Streptomyces sp900129855]|uniref:D-inositol 3-phosphate glycosyltransferase n=1 Tax=Streptomyces sp. 900129855 TaxID=3155129 RepID=A0ABV2ZLI8_9ACTN